MLIFNGANTLRKVKTVLKMKISGFALILFVHIKIDWHQNCSVIVTGMFLKARYNIRRMT